MKVLFVCTGNTCRSPMAAGMLERAARQRRLEITVSSAGVGAWEGAPATAEAVIAAADYGVDLKRHRARRLTAALVEGADLVLTMTRRQKEDVLALVPGARGKVYALKEYVARIEAELGGGQEERGPGGSKSETIDIPDPIGCSLAVYRSCAGELHAATETLAAFLARKRASAGMKGEETMRVALGADHGGFHLKEAIKEWLTEWGIEYQDFGTHSAASVDYPDYALAVAERVAAGEFDRGILVCGTGIGMCIAANKVPGIRAALCHDVFSARATREHNDSNVLTLGERVIGQGLAREIVQVWLQTGFVGDRHARRVEKIRTIEERYRGAGAGEA